MQKVIVAVITGFLLFSFANLGFAAATQVDALIEKLVEKGILTPKEAMSLKMEIAEDEKIFREEGVKGELPGWVKNTKLKGDLRTRYQWEEREGRKERHRSRIRFRLGLETEVNDEVKVAAGLTTGKDPRSANQTLENFFESPEIRLDYAYAEYSPFKWLNLKGGKIDKMPFWIPSDLLWDSDISPDGASLGLNFKGSPMSLFFNTGIFVLDESAGETSDPFMFALQPGVDFELAKGVNLKTALAYYDFGNVKGSRLDYSSASNTARVVGGIRYLVYDYNPLVGSFELGFKELLGFIPYFALLADYVHNPEPPKNNDGFLIGCKFGEKKVKGPGQWQVKYLYRHLEKDAFLDTFPDSDFYGGSTNAKGHEIIFQYGLLKNVILGLDYYYSWPIEGAKKKERLLQVDVEFKF